MSQRWTYWTTVAVTTFGVLEGHSIARGRPTLSLWLRWAIGIEPQRSRRFLLGPLFAGFLGWLGLHVLGDLGPHLERDA